MRIIHQPENGTLAAVLEELLVEEFDEFLIMTAYARRSGVSRLWRPIEAFRESGGKVTAVVGVDQANTTAEALESLSALCDRAYVYHNENPGQTFHPKSYLAVKANVRAVVCVGSSNLTLGGLETNNEVMVVRELVLSRAEDTATFDEIMGAYRFHTDPTSPLCLPITPDLIGALVDSQYVSREGEATAEPQGEAQRQAIFGWRAIAGRAGRALLRQLAGAPAEPTNAAARSRGGARAGFWKRLSANDVSLTSSPGQIVIPIRFLKDFPPFSEEIQWTGGASQADVLLDVSFEDPTNQPILIQGARAICYTPAPDHPRPNRELRFTFRNRGVSSLLREGDILVFRRTGVSLPSFVVRRLELGNEENTRLSAMGSYGEVGG